MLLELEKYYPIDRDDLKKRWDEIMNVPNQQWDGNDVDSKIEVINDTNLPGTLRTVMLNMLPALAISILDKHKNPNCKCTTIGGPPDHSLNGTFTSTTNCPIHND